MKADARGSTLPDMLKEFSHLGAKQIKQFGNQGKK